MLKDIITFQKQFQKPLVKVFKQETQNTSFMKLNNITKVKESYSDEEANKYLSKGYEILKIISTRRTSLEVDEVRPCYILGLKK